jgi:hypothetical protein
MKELAAKLGVSHTAYKRWELHMSMPVPRLRKALVSYLGFDAEQTGRCPTHDPSVVERVGFLLPDSIGVSLLLAPSLSDAAPSSGRCPSAPRRPAFRNRLSDFPDAAARTSRSFGGQPFQPEQPCGKVLVPCAPLTGEDRGQLGYWPAKTAFSQ